jgi:hypothetical protein
MDDKHGGVPADECPYQLERLDCTYSLLDVAMTAASFFTYNFNLPFLHEN